MDVNERDRDLLRRAAALSREADEVLVDLGLPELFAPVGHAERVGSASFGLALTRDIDFNIMCPSLDAGQIWNTLRPLAQHPCVKKVRWTDERGRFNFTGVAVDEGIYCGVHYYAGEVRDDLRWKLDCWFLPEEVGRPEVVMRDRLLAAPHEERLAILRLKDAAIRAGRYGPEAELQGIHIYRAVLDRGVRDYSDL